MQPHRINRPFAQSANLPSPPHEPRPASKIEPNMKHLQNIVAASLFLFCLTAAAQQARGNWRAASSTARTITGDITIATEKMSINFISFPISQARALDPAETHALFDPDSTTPAPGTATLYHLNIPAERKFLNRNSLCGSDDTQWMVTYVTGRSLQLAFFSSQKPPVFTLEAISNSTDLCGTFAYIR